MAHEIVIPRLGWSMEEGAFVGWLKNDGDHVRRGERLFELEGEKATQEIEAVDEGILRIPSTGLRCVQDYVMLRRGLANVRRRGDREDGFPEATRYRSAHAGR